MGLTRKNVNDLPQGTSILIISALGSSLDIYEYAPLGGSKLLDSLDVELWELNRSLENYLYSALKNPRLRFCKYHELSNNNEIKLIRKKWRDKIDTNDLKNQIIKISEARDIDKILVLSEGYTDWSNAIIGGYGICRYKSLFKFGKTVTGIAYTCMELKWYDARTMRGKSVSFYLDVASVRPERIDRIYSDRDWSLFRYYKDQYVELLQNCLDIMLKKSALDIM
jgi:hypothetical protein